MTHRISETSAPTDCTALLLKNTWTVHLDKNLLFVLASLTEI